MIDRKLILANAPSNIGDQVHINHKGCEAGEDTKRRLYVKRTHKGLVAYCHHCNDKGFASDNNRLAGWINKETVVKKQQEKLVLASLTTKGKVWLMQHYCDATDKLFSGVVSEPSRVALTLLGPDQEVIGWQVRNLDPNPIPKYITHYTKDTHNGDSAWFYKGNKTLVITEDYLSAYRVHKDTGLSSVAMLRTSLSDKTLTKMFELEFEFIFIWLDPDKAGQEGTKKVYKQLNHYLPSKTKIAILGIDKEPKECTPTELSGILL